MKVLLINPPSSHILREVVSLGLLSVATILNKNKYEVKIIDATACNTLLDNDQICDIAKLYRPNVIGINLMTPFVPNCYRLVKNLKPLGAILIAGGPHATLIPDEVLQHGFDVVIRGEGEVTILELLNKLKRNKSIGDVAGISFSDGNGKIVTNPSRPLIQNLDSLPFPDYGLMDLKNYSVDKKNTLRIFSVLTSRSCPCQCIYCANARLFRGNYRTRSPESIFQEIMELKSKYDVKYIRFVDDTLTIKRERIYKLMELMKNAKELRDVKWECDSRIDCVDEALLKSMKDAGCEAVIYGIESYDNESLRFMKKGTNTKKIDKAIEATKKVGLFMNINLIIGFKWETLQHINNTLRLLAIDYKNCQYPNGIPIPWPGTELYDRYHKDLGFTNWWLKAENFPEDYYIKGREKPFYSPRFIGINNISMTDKTMDSWKLDKNMKRILYRAIFKFSKRSLTNINGTTKGTIIYYLSHLSLILFNINPLLEYAAFKVLKKIRHPLQLFKGAIGQ